MDNARAEAKERLTLGFWIVLLGLSCGLVSMVLPFQTRELEEGSAALVIETWSTALVFLACLGGCGALAYWGWEHQRGLMWPIAVIGLLLAMVGVGQATETGEGIEPAVGSWVALGAGLLLIMGGTLMTVVLRRIRTEGRIEAKAKAFSNADSLPAPMLALPPEGWYTDPKDDTRSRWWDGAKWTDATRRSAGTELAVEMPPAAN